MKKEPESAATQLERLAQLVAVGYSVADACKECNISESIAYKNSAKAEVKARVYVIRTNKMEDLSAKALGAATTAVATLKELATSSEKDSDRIAACKAILDKVMPFAELAELRRRLDQLEQRASQED